MKKYVYAVAFAWCCISNGYSLNLEGKYACAGNEVGTHAAFTCEMTVKRTGETYISDANCSDGNSYNGTGIYDKHTQQLSTAFINPKKSDETGISVVTLRTNGDLDNVWTYLNKTTTEYTKCTKVNNKS